jgi:hypothetical protein
MPFDWLSMTPQEQLDAIAAAPPVAGPWTDIDPDGWSMRSLSAAQEPYFAEVYMRDGKCSAGIYVRQQRGALNRRLGDDYESFDAVDAELTRFGWRLMDGAAPRNRTGT